MSDFIKSSFCFKELESVGVLLATSSRTRLNLSITNATKTTHHEVKKISIMKLVNVNMPEQLIGVGLVSKQSPSCNKIIVGDKDTR